jgi:hypothetical protein
MNWTDTASPTEASPIAPVSSPAMRKASDLVFQYRQQAAELRDMAWRLELEAEVYAERRDQERLQQTREVVKSLRAAADIADEQARLYRSQVLHNQVY